MNSQVMKAPDFEKTLKLAIDACAIGAGDVLFQDNAYGMFVTFQRRFTSTRNITLHEYNRERKPVIALHIALLPPHLVNQIYK